MYAFKELEKIEHIKKINKNYKKDERQKAGNDILRNTRNQGTLSYPLLFLLLSYISQHYGENDDREERERQSNP